MCVEDVKVDVRARPPDQAVLEAALELAEKADVGPEVQVSMQQVALNEVVVVPMAIGGRSQKTGSDRTRSGDERYRRATNSSRPDRPGGCTSGRREDRFAG